MKLFIFTLVLSMSCRPTPTPTPAVSDAMIAVDAATPPAPMPPLPSHVCVVAGVYHLPNPEWTPGALCAPEDPDFKEWRYKVHVAYCQRNITASEKDRVAARYGVAKGDYGKYEFDHFIPLSAGGSNDDANLWPQPIDEARQKDQVELEVYNGLNGGTMTQDEAVAKIRAWKPQECP